jgi:DNA-directed RNA polymerase subunit E'/Rpb7
MTSSNNIVSPFKNMTDTSQIIVECYQMNSDIKIHMLNNLKKKLEKRCNKNGYIDTVYNITKFTFGLLRSEDLSGNAVYDVSYNCRMCLPVVNTVIIGLIKVIDSELIVCIHGPIMCFIQKQYIDNTIWKDMRQVLNELKTGDYIKVQILDTMINYNDEQIKILGRLLGKPSIEEIDKYYLDNNKINDTNNNFII